MTEQAALLRQLQADDPTECIAAAEALGRQKNVDAVEPLLDLLRHDDIDVKRAAVVALRRIRDERASVPFIYLFNDEDDAVRRGVSAWFMGLRGDQSHLVEPLCEVLTAPESRISTREFAAMLLGKFGDEHALDALHDALEMYPQLRLRITQTLQRTADPRSVPYLVPLLDATGDPRLPRVAAKTLKMIGTPAALAAVEVWQQRG